MSPVFSISQELSTFPSLEKGSPTDWKPPKWAWLPACSCPYPTGLEYLLFRFMEIELASSASWLQSKHFTS